jgi:hypothetical protein
MERRRRDPERRLVRLKHQRPAVGVDHGMALAALDLFSGVITPGAAGFDGLDALTVDHRRRGAGLAPDPLAIAHEEVSRRS